MPCGFGHSSGARPGVMETIGKPETLSVTNITQPPHVALYQIQLPGQKSDKTRSFHPDRFFRKSLRRDSVQERSVKAGPRDAAEVDEIMNAADFLSGIDWSIICFGGATYRSIFFKIIIFFWPLLITQNSLNAKTYFEGSDTIISGNFDMSGWYLKSKAQKWRYLTIPPKWLSWDGIESSRDWPKCWLAPTGPTDSSVFRMINA